MYVKNTDTKKKEIIEYRKLIIRLPRKTKNNFEKYCLKKKKSMNSVVNELIDSILENKTSKEASIS